MNSVGVIKILAICGPTFFTLIFGAILVTKSSLFGITGIHYSTVVFSEDQPLYKETKAETNQASIKCKLENIETLFNCSVGKIEKTNSKNWTDLKTIKLDGFSSHINSDFFHNPAWQYKLKIGTEAFAHLSQKSNEQISVVDSTNPDKKYASLKPSVVYQEKDKKLVGKTSFFLAKANAFKHVQTKKVSTQSEAAFAMKNNKFKCSFSGAQASSSKDEACEIFAFAASEVPTQDGVIDTLKLIRPDVTAENIHLNKHYLVKFSDLHGIDKLNSINASVVAAYPSSPTSNITDIVFTQIAPVIFHPPKAKNIALVLKD